jgi:hypothetical protein
MPLEGQAERLRVANDLLVSLGAGKRRELQSREFQ